MAIKKINCETLARFPAFSHAVISGDFIHISGTLGTKHNKLEIVEGGVEKETAQILFHIGTILDECDAVIQDLVKVTVFLTDMDDYHDMNSAYLDIIDFEPPSRTTVGVKELALGASVEIECIAYRPRG